MNREDMIAVLKNGMANVVFVKLNGEERHMLATLRPDLLPETKGTGRAPNPDLITVLDVEKNEWRAFRVDSVKSFSPA